MAKKAKEKQTKLQFKPTPISRLRYWRNPCPMVGDPKHNGSWADRERKVYAAEMDKRETDGRGWKNLTYYKAEEDNRRLDRHIRDKWTFYHVAIEDNFLFDQMEALRENAAWDYHRENFIPA